jgi:hypothetical protein
LIPEVQLLEGLQETVEFMELPVQLGLIKQDRNRTFRKLRGTKVYGGKSRSAGPGRTFPTYSARESEMLYERERLVTEDAASLAARRETVTPLLEDSATVFGEGSLSSARASL